MADSTKQTNEADSMLDLAEKLREGKGKTQDINRAFVLSYEAIAKGRKTRALRTLAYYYRWGLFTTRDHEKANDLYCRSANSGSKFAYYQLGRSYLEGWGVKKNLAAAKFLFEKAIEKGSQKASDEIKKIPNSIRSDKSGITGYTGEPDKSPLPDFLTADYEKAKSGTLWTEEFEKYRCKTCYGEGRVPCPECGGTAEVECKKCHGDGGCPTCNGTGKEVCPECDGTGKNDCPVCDHGKVKKTRMVYCRNCHGTGETKGGSCGDCGGLGERKEAYYEFCPSCNGDYKGFKGKCSNCHGTGIATCHSCHGSGKCRSCHGSGKVKCDTCHLLVGRIVCPECKGMSNEKIRKWKERQDARVKHEMDKRERTRSSHQEHSTFLTLGLIFGLLGVHYAYIGRWFMFLVQIVLTGWGMVQIFNPAINEWIQNFMIPCGMKLNELGTPWLGIAVQYPTLTLAVLWCLFGVIFIIKDGTNHEMKPRNNLAVYILIILLQSVVAWFILFGITTWPTGLLWSIIRDILFFITISLHFMELLANGRSPYLKSSGLKEDWLIALGINLISLILLVSTELAIHFELINPVNDIISLVGNGAKILWLGVYAFETFKIGNDLHRDYHVASLMLR